MWKEVHSHARALYDNDRILAEPKLATLDSFLLSKLFHNVQTWGRLTEQQLQRVNGAHQKVIVKLTRGADDVDYKDPMVFAAARGRAEAFPASTRTSAVDRSTPVASRLHAAATKMVPCT